MPDETPPTQAFPAEGSQRLGGRMPILILGGIALLLVAWRLDGIASRCLWFDEAFSWRLTRFSWGEMLDRAARDVHPPLYYVFLKAWEGVAGDSAPALRLPSILWFCASLAAAWALVFEAARGRPAHAGSRETALLAVVLLSASPMLHRYSQEARMYTQAVALALGSTAILLRALREVEHPARWWVGYAFAAAALAYTHYFGVLTLAAQGAFSVSLIVLRNGLVPWRNRQLVGYIGAIALIGLLYLPWLPTMLAQQSQVSRDYWASEPEKESPLQLELWRSIIYRSIALDSAEQTSPKVEAAKVSPWIVNAVVLGFLATLAALAVRNDRVGWCLFSMIVLPADFAVLVSFGTNRSLIETRFLMASLAAWLIGLALVLARIRPASLRHGLSALAVGGMIFASWSYRESLGLPEHSESKHAAARIAGELNPGDRVVSVSPSAYVPLVFHAAGRFPLHQARGGPVEIRHYNGGPIFRDEDFVDWETVRGLRDGRIWLVGTREDLDAASHPSNWSLVASESFPEAIRWRGPLVVECWSARGREENADAQR